MRGRCRADLRWFALPGNVAAMFSHRTFCWLLATALVAAEPASGEAEAFFKKNDVVALVGGEDMVVASELGYLEFLLVREYPEYRLKFRCLAWEGDTVFEQPRMLNYPPLEKQLDEIGATVVLMQFGQMECLAGRDKLPDFIAAYQRLIERLRGAGRRVALFSPMVREDSRPGREATSLLSYARAIEQLASEMEVGLHRSDSIDPARDHRMLRDGNHLSPAGHAIKAESFTGSAGRQSRGSPLIDRINGATGTLSDKREERLRQLIGEKDRLWFNYYRPQNWAFLAGDRISQPSSHDYRDPTKRWFPDEMQQFLPLIEAKEKEIWALAEELAQQP
jgi:hypothetical protein